jgi:Raf kinase inhibitor-like YbhB/YbcL family protein
MPQVDNTDLAMMPDLAVMAGGTLKMTSTAFGEGANIPTQYAYTNCGVGAMNICPALAWTGAPPGTSQFALIVDDLDAGSFVHWVLYGLSPQRTNLSEGVSTTMPPDLKTTTNDFGELGYGGPCPQPGETHRYNFTLYALDVQFGTASSAADLKSKMMGHIKDQARYSGKYAR